jgi:shikimate dehydrogenase
MLVQLAMQIFGRWTGIRPDEAVFQAAVSTALGEARPSPAEPVSGPPPAAGTC